ncbi:MAG: fimbria/pilus periplasmic chaperone [Pseudomonadota bacterium]|nr:fimbria/pilus periplasmic chaperone [Pseudomonadota bacterium]
MRPTRRLAVAGLVALAMTAGAAHARGQLQTRQTSIELPVGQRAGRLVLANTGDAPMAAQIRVYAWSQDGNDDQLEPTDAMTASPPILEIAAGGEQLVRLVRDTAAAVAGEQAYRVVVDELPGDPTGNEGSAVTVRMRYVLPMFVRAADPAPAALDCRIDQQSVACRNSGGIAAQLSAAQLVDARGRRVELAPGLLGYVLANSARRFPLDAAKLATVGMPAALEVSLNGQPASIDLRPDL